MWRPLLPRRPLLRQRDLPKLPILASPNPPELRNAQCTSTRVQTSRCARTFIVRQAGDFSLLLTSDQGCFELRLHNVKGLEVSEGWFSVGLVPSESHEGFVKGGLTLCRAQNAHATHIALCSTDLLKISVVFGKATTWHTEGSWLKR